MTPEEAGSALAAQMPRLTDAQIDEMARILVSCQPQADAA